MMSWWGWVLAGMALAVGVMLKFTQRSGRGVDVADDALQAKLKILVDEVEREKGAADDAAAKRSHSSRDRIEDLRRPLKPGD